MGIGKTGEMNRKAVYDQVKKIQTTNKLPIPVNENNMPMFATDTEYLNYLQEYDPEMFMQMQNEFYNTRGTMGQGSPLKGLLDRIMGGN
jgi:hypothetical protein